MFHITIGDTSPELQFYKESIINAIIENLNVLVPQKQNGLVHVAFVSKDVIQNLNKEHRGKDSPTDILSFHYFEDFSNLEPNSTAADIIMCLPILKEQGEKYGLGLDGEFYKLLIHGLVHVLGYDHETLEEFKEMEAYEKKVRDAVFPSLDYPSSERFV